MSLHFDISADNSSFMQRMNEIRTGVQNASGVIKNLARDFDVSTVENKIIALNKVIRDNESVIYQSSKQIEKWELDAREAFNNNDISTFSTITKDIEDQSKKIAELISETKQYYDALSMVESSGGAEASSVKSVSAPQFFRSQADYEYAESLRSKIEDIQSQIAEFDGSDKDLQKLRSSLSQTENKLRGCQLEAAQAASELGENLGSRAAETSESLYILNNAAEKQEAIVKSLSIAVQEAAQSLDSLRESDDIEALDNAQIKYDTLAISLQNAQMELANIQAAQSDASMSFAKINQEVEQHDSLIVKMLGGYENYQVVIGQLPGPIQSIIGSINGMTGAAKAFIATPLGAVIASIVLVLQSLKTWFDSSVDGQKAFAEISGYVSGVLDQLKEIVISVGNAIYNAFSNPKKAVIDLWNAIKTNFVNRVKSVGEMAKSLGGLLKAALTFDSDAIIKEFNNLTNSFLKFGTGIDNVTGKVSKYVKGVNEAAKANARLAKEEKEIEIATAEEQKRSAQRQLEMTKARTKIYNAKASTAEKESAREEYLRLNNEDIQAQLNLQDRRIALQEGRMALTTNTIEDENALRELQAQRTQIENQGAQREMMLQRMSNRIDKQDKQDKQSGATAEQTASKRTESQRKIIDLMKSQAEERLRLQQEYEYQEWQNRIDLMEEGEAKVLAQMELDHSKEMTSLEAQKRQAVQAEIARQKALFDARQEELSVGNKKYAKEIFNPDKDVSIDEVNAIIDRYDSLQDQLIQKQKKVESDRLDVAKESFNAYLQEFGTYQQKREAIATDYDTRIAASANAGDRMMLEAQKNKALSDLDYQQWIDSGEIALAFKDIERYSSDTVGKLIADMEKYRTKVISTFDPEKIEKYEEALRKLRKLDAEQSFGVFSNFVPDYFKEKAAAAKELRDAEENMNALYEERARLMSQLLSLQEDIVNEVKKQTGTKISMTDALDVDKLKSIIAQISASGGDSSGLQGMVNMLPQLQNGIQQSGIAAQNAQQSFMGLQEAFAGSFSGGAEALAMVDTIVHGINDIVQGLNGTFNELSSTAEALGADMSDGSSWSQAGIVMQGFADASEGATQAWDSLKSGNIMGVVQGVVKSFTSWIKAFAAFSDAKHERKIKQIQEQIDALEKSYDKLGKAADKVYSTDASKLINQQNTLLRQQQALIRQQMAEEEAKKKTDDDKIKEYKERLEEINELLEENAEKAKEAIIGKDVKSAIDEFASLYAGAWDDGTDAAQKSMAAVKSIISGALTELLKKNIQPAATSFYDTLAKAMEDGILTDAELANLDTIKAQMDALAATGEEQYSKIQERYRDLDELCEELTDISFDSVRDNFKSLLSDMTSTTEDFTESFTDMLRNALVNGLMDSKYDKMLKEWYGKFAEAMDDQTLTDSERDALRQQYDAIVQQGIADRNAINAIVGGGAYSQQASSGSAWNMNQETGEELNGRFTAMVELEATNNVLVSDGNAIAREILMTLRTMSGLSMTVTGNGDNETLLAIKDMMFLSTGYLEDIAKYSKLLADISSDVAEMKSAVKDL